MWPDHQFADYEQTGINCCNQAIAQVCAFYSPELGILSAMEIYHELTIVTPGWRVVFDGKKLQSNGYRHVMANFVFVTFSTFWNRRNPMCHDISPT